VKRFLLIGLSMTCLAQTQTSGRVFKPTGSAQFEADSEGVVVHFDGRGWKPDLSQLPLKAKDCPENPEAEKACTNARLACLACITEWEPVAWDEPREIFYMAAGLDVGKNRPWIIFAYDLRSDRIRRIGTEEGGGFNGAGMSPSGRYLAYIGYAVCGVCCTTSDLHVIDTQTLITGTFALRATDDNDRPRVLAVRWAGPSTIEYDAQIVRESACKEGKDPDPSWTASVQVAQILK
jgi:hypothetical protein